MNQLSQSFSRRDLARTAAAVGAFAALGAPAVYAAGNETLKVGLIGCGRRGTGAIQDHLKINTGVELFAIADALQDRADGAYNDLKNRLGDKFKVTPDKKFVGFDAYQKLIDSGVDIVLLCVPPGFRPQHFAAAVKAGKHVFMEKPVAVDPAGVRSILATADEAEKKGLCVVAGTQRRHQESYLEIFKRIKDGAIGDIVAAQAYWIGDWGYYTPPTRDPKWSDLEWQLRNWNYWVWLSGDIIVEQHVHNLDIMNWALGSPTKVFGSGSRMVRNAPEFGHIFDNFSCAFEYPNGVAVTSMCRQWNGCGFKVFERIQGTKGIVYTDQPGNAIITGPKGEQLFKYAGPNNNPYELEHRDLVAAIRAGKPIMDARNVANSTMMAVIGRMSAYTGREVSWDWAMKASKLNTFPAEALAFGPMPTPPVAMPGQTKLE